ncbi:MAG: phosphoribosylformylglycinamidine cyclo-ligase [Roseiflexaceae bacterium]
MSSYRAAGVDIEAGNRATQLMAAAVRSTHGPAVLAGIGSFGGCLDLGSILQQHNIPATQAVLVSSTDGVGTKTVVAAALGRYDTVGQDLVNHCVNDILVQGARPIFFMDYFATSKLDPQQVADVVAGIAQACRNVGCALLGGETAEMPDVYADQAFDLAGTIVGIVDRQAMLPRPVAAGDVLLALPSSGLHTNGYSLARRVVQGKYDQRPDILGGASLGEALLAIHRPYLAEYDQLQAAGIDLKALAHITGGGVYDNLPRVLPDGVGALIRRGSWEVPPIFTWLVEEGDLDDREAFHALNMGIGMVVVLSAEQADAAIRALPTARLVGELIDGEGVRVV